MSGLRVLGAILNGGRGTRFGGPKAQAPVAGIAMVERVLAVVGAVTDRLVLVGAEAPGLAVRALPDRVPGAGPLGGLDTALAEAEATAADAVLLVACDLPLLEAAPLRRLVDALADAPAVAPSRPGGVETACAVWRVGARSAVRAALASEDRSLHALFRELGGRAVDPHALGFATGRHLLNVNARADRERAERLLAEDDDA